MPLPGPIKEAELKARLDTAIKLGNALTAAIVDGAGTQHAVKSWCQFIKGLEEVPI